MVLERVLPLARCPDCLGPLELKDAQRAEASPQIPLPESRAGTQILAGTLICNTCKTAYRIVDGIPILYPR